MPRVKSIPLRVSNFLQYFKLKRIEIPKVKNLTIKPYQTSRKTIEISNMVNMVKHKEIGIVNIVFPKQFCGECIIFLSHSDKQFQKNTISNINYKERIETKEPAFKIVNTRYTTRQINTTTYGIINAACINVNTVRQRTREIYIEFPILSSEHSRICK